MLKIADRKLSEIGFEKAEESDGFVSYERENEDYNYIQCLEICEKESGYHLVWSYVKDTNSEGFNNVVGLTGYEMKLALRKMKEMGVNVNGMGKKKSFKGFILQTQKSNA